MTGYVYRGTQRLDEGLTATCRGARGTVGGYGRHARKHERPCDACREAMNAYNRKRRRTWKPKAETRAKERQRRKARARAWAALAALHPDEFRLLKRRELGQLMAEEAAELATRVAALHAEPVGVQG